MNNFLPKWLVTGLGGLLIIFVAFLIVQQGYNLKTMVKNSRPANTISVSGEGKVSAVPDLATVSIGVFSEGSNATDLKNQSNEKVNKVIAFVKAQGIDAKDIATSQYNLQPKYDYTKGQPVVNGYQVNQMVTVKVHGVDNNTSVVDKLVDGAVDSGANQINGVSFSLEKPTDLQNEARKLAIEDAKKKAEELAAASGLKLGKVISVSESGGGYPSPMPYMSDSFGGVANEMKSVAPTLEPGSQEITQTMTLTFELK